MHVCVCVWTFNFNFCLLKYNPASNNRCYIHPKILIRKIPFTFAIRMLRKKEMASGGTSHLWQ